MPETGFLPWVRYVKAEAKHLGVRLTAREARAITPAVIVALQINDDGERDTPPLHNDPTGEQAVKNVLKEMSNA